jgi:sulfonate transport system substrate-binding protein
MDGFFRRLLAGAIFLGMTEPAGAEQLPDVIRIAGVATGVGRPVGVGLLGVAQVKGFIEAEFKDTPVKLES